MSPHTMNNIVVETGRILVVDDSESNRFLLKETLELDGHHVMTAQSGAEALRMTEAEKPEVVLLDVNMPGMSGLDVCRRLKGDAATAAIPVILVTALVDREHRLRGIAAGANEYLTKPIDRTEVRLRVGNALRLYQLHVTVSEQYRSLRELEGLRDNLVHMVVHDLRGPLTGMNLGLELIREQLEESANPQLAEDLAAVLDCVGWLSGMVDDVLDVSRLEADALPLQRSPSILSELANEALASLGPSASALVTISAGQERRPALVDRDLIRRVIANLLFNAIKFSSPGSPVHVEITSDDHGVMLRIKDSGRGIPREFQDRIFEKFGQIDGPSSGRVRSSGLGLAFCRLAVESHGGRIGVESTEGQGSTFWVNIPAA